uniref:Ubiquitin-like protease family profile domain-containing protein n=1 Tax=Solanum lycopersicum TaxID=4081 RepID=A0A3Q7IXS3_SOLLC
MEECCPFSDGNCCSTLPPEGVEKSTEGVQTEPHRDIDEQALSRQNSDDDFVNPPPPSMKVTGKRKKGQSVSPAKRVRKKDSNITDQMERNEQIDPIAKRNVKKAVIKKVVTKKIMTLLVKDHNLLQVQFYQKIKISKPKKIRPFVFERQHDFTDQDDNDEEDQFIFPTPIQSIVPMEGSQQSQFELDDSLMPRLSDIKSICVTDNTINAEQSIIMHIQTTSNDNSNMQKQASMEIQNKISHVHTPLPAHRIRRSGPFNTSPYLTLFDSSAGTSSVQPIIFELKHPFIFDLISDNRDIIMWDAHQSWIREGLLAKHENKAAGHDAAFRKEVTKFAQLIPLKLTMDCGIYMLAFAEWLSYGQGNPSGTFDIMFLRSRYAALL